MFFVAVALALSLALHWALPHRDRPKLYDYSLRDSLFRALSADTLYPAESLRTNRLQPVIQKATPAAALKKKGARGKSGIDKKRILKPHSININSAEARELEKLPGIGPKTAQAIIIYRRLHGPFTRVDDLKKVKRIGPKTLKKIAPYIVLGK